MPAWQCKSAQDNSGPTAPTAGVVAATVAGTACYPAGVMAARLPSFLSSFFPIFSFFFFLVSPRLSSSGISLFISHRQFFFSVTYHRPSFTLTLFQFLSLHFISLAYLLPPYPLPPLSPSSGSRLSRRAVLHHDSDPNEANDKVGL